MSTSLPSLISVGRSLVTGFTQLVYPNTCWTCGELMPPEQSFVCPSCFPRLTSDPFSTCPCCSSTVGPHLTLEKGCPECRDQSFAFDRAFRIGPYEGLLRDVVLQMKHSTGEDIAEVMASLWAPHMADRLSALKPEVVVPIPLHWTRRWRRGFNACDFLASGLAQALRIPCRRRALRRTRATAQQTAQTSSTARRENVKNAFEARRGQNLRDRAVVLVDDVLTTGATANEAARALRALKPKAIYVAVLAHGR